MKKRLVNSGRRMVACRARPSGEQGYREGKEECGEDAEKGRPSNAKGREDYLDSDSRAFRVAFLEGYEAGESDETAKGMREQGLSRGGRTPARAAPPTRRPTRITSRRPAGQPISAGGPEQSCGGPGRGATCRRRGMDAAIS